MSRRNDDPGNALRIVVRREYLGAIIGHQGNNLREIGTKTYTLINITSCHKFYNIINIHGSQVSCSEACKRILYTIESHMMRHEEILNLRILAYDYLIGRFIGTKGNRLHYLMEMSKTIICVNPKSHLHRETQRIITITALNIEPILLAERCVSNRLRSIYRQFLSVVKSNKFTPIINPLSMHLNTIVSRYNAFNSTSIYYGGGDGFQENNFATYPNNIGNTDSSAVDVNTNTYYPNHPEQLLANNVQNNHLQSVADFYPTYILCGHYINLTPVTFINDIDKNKYPPYYLIRYNHQPNFYTEEYINSNTENNYSINDA